MLSAGGTSRKSKKQAILLLLMLIAGLVPAGCGGGSERSQASRSLLGTFKLLYTGSARIPWYASYSPDGDWIAVVSDLRLRLFDRSQELHSVLELSSEAIPCAPTFSRNSKSLYLLCHGKLNIYDYHDTASRWSLTRSFEVPGSDYVDRFSARMILHEDGTTLLAVVEGRLLAIDTRSSNGRIVRRSNVIAVTQAKGGQVALGLADGVSLYTEWLSRSLEVELRESGALVCNAGNTEVALTGVSPTVYRITVNGASREFSHPGRHHYEGALPEVSPSGEYVALWQGRFATRPEESSRSVGVRIVRVDDWQSDVISYDLYVGMAFSPEDTALVTGGWMAHGGGVKGDGIRVWQIPH